MPATSQEPWPGLHHLDEEHHEGRQAGDEDAVADLPRGEADDAQGKDQGGQGQGRGGEAGEHGADQAAEHRAADPLQGPLPGRGVEGLHRQHHRHGEPVRERPGPDQGRPEGGRRHHGGAHGVAQVGGGEGEVRAERPEESGPEGRGWPGPAGRRRAGSRPASRVWRRSGRGRGCGWRGRAARGHGRGAGCPGRSPAPGGRGRSRCRRGWPGRSPRGADAGGAGSGGAIRRRRGSGSPSIRSETAIRAAKICSAASRRIRAWAVRSEMRSRLRARSTITVRACSIASRTPRRWARAWRSKACRSKVWRSKIWRAPPAASRDSPARRDSRARSGRRDPRDRRRGGSGGARPRPPRDGSGDRDAGATGAAPAASPTGPRR